MLGGWTPWNVGIDAKKKKKKDTWEIITD